MMDIQAAKEFVMAKGEVKAFCIQCVSDVDIEVMVTLEGFPKGCCLYCSGRDYLGKAFEKYARCMPQKPKNLWCYIEIPEDAVPGRMDGQISVRDKHGDVLAVSELSVVVLDTVMDDSQFDDIQSLRRLKWLNSNRAIDHSVVKPFLPVLMKDHTVRILGREIVLNKLGFVQQARSYFGQDIKIGTVPTAVLDAPLELCIPGQTFRNQTWETHLEEDSAAVLALNQSEDFIMRVSAMIEFDGYMRYKISLEPKRDVEVEDIRMVIPVSSYCQKYFMGLGKKGGYFQRELNWKWNQKAHQDSFWVGNVNAGLRVAFKDHTYVQPLVNIYYDHRPLQMPKSWCNDGLGGIRFRDSRFIAYSGRRAVRKGEILHFDFDLMLTPLKEIDLQKQFHMRFLHKFPDCKQWIEQADKAGANIINIHHGTDLNPYINYPFFETEALREFVQEAHRHEILTKIYYTIRELTIYLPEFQAFRDMDYEIFVKMNRDIESHLWQGEAKEWIRQNVGEDVIPAWRQPFQGEKYHAGFDSSIITDGQSRLCNFYIEGLNRLIKNIDIDGLYIDDVTFDRNTMKRVRKVLDQKENSLIDFHTWNHFNDRAGMANCANLYMELFPYIDKLWIGEGFQYDESPDYWLVEISGIPFGLMSEMLQNGGNQWRGLVFGMTNRLGWDEKNDPTNIWELIDQYQLDRCRFIGFWSDENPVQMNNENLVTSVYEDDRYRYIAVANWSNQPQSAVLRLSDMEGSHFYAPYIRNFQEETALSDEIFLEAGKGCFLVGERR